MPASVETIAFKSPVHQVRVRKLVLSPMKRQNCLVLDIVMLDTTRRLRLDLMEKLVIFMLDIALKSLSPILFHIEIVIATSVVGSVEAAALIVCALDLAPMVIVLAILLVMMRRRPVHPMVHHVLLPSMVRLKQRQIVPFIYWLNIVYLLSEGTVLMMDDLVALVEPRMMVDMVLPAVLDGPEQLLIGGLVQHGAPIEAHMLAY